jgi:hypothetical protein
VEDIRANPVDGVVGTTMDRVKKELDNELSNGFGAPLAADQPVNDLSSMVKKKKPKPPPTDAAPAFNPLVPDATALPSLGKRKAEEEPEREDKKQKVE